MTDICEKVTPEQIEALKACLEYGGLTTILLVSLFFLFFIGAFALYLIVKA